MALVRFLAALIFVALVLGLVGVGLLDEEPVASLIAVGFAALAWGWYRSRQRIEELEGTVDELEAGLARLERVVGKRLREGGIAAAPAPVEASAPDEALAPTPATDEALAPAPTTAAPAALPADEPEGLEPTPPADPPAVPRGTAPERRRERLSRPPARPRPATTEWTVDRLPEPLQRAWAFATGGNPLARVAVLVLFVGLGLAVQLLGTGVQLGVLAAVGAGLIGLGWRLREGTPGFGLTLQGGGVAVLYLTVYAAYALYGLIPSLAAVALMAVVAVVCGGLALAQDAPGLAVLGVAGGFAAPVLAGTPDGNHLLLLGYYALLNLGVLAVAWARGWRSVALVGFVATFVTGGLWGGVAYRPELYASVQPFVILSFAIYLALAVRFALRSARHGAEERALVVDGALVFGLPAATFVLQAGLVEEMAYGRAWSATALAAVYLAGAVALRKRANVRLLADAALAVGLAFATLAVPLAFGRVVFGAVWVLEGAGLVWVGARQRKGWMRAAGLALQGAAAFVLFGEGVLAPSTTFTAATLTGWIVAVGLGLSAYVLRRFAAPDAADDGERNWLGATDAQVRHAEATVGRAFLAFALLWWIPTAAVHVTDLLVERLWLTGFLGASAASGMVFLALGRALAWPALRAASLLTVAAGWVLLVGALFLVDEPLAVGRGVGWLALGGAVVAALWDRHGHGSRRAAFVAAVWLAPAVLAYVLGSLVDDALGEVWGVAVVGAIGVAGLAFALTFPARWAAADERRPAVWGLVGALTLWLVGSWGSAGAADPLATLPLLNPLDAVAAAVMLALLAVWRTAGDARGPFAVALGALGFGAITAATLRAVVALTGLRYDGDVLFESPTAQAALAVAWTVLGLALAVVAVRRASRPLWFFGAAVLGLVVAKLFLVDLTQADALVRVVAFVTVGLLMLVVGWRAPLPPRTAEAPEPAPDDDPA